VFPDGRGFVFQETSNSGGIINLTPLSKDSSTNEEFKQISDEINNDIKNIFDDKITDDKITDDNIESTFNEIKSKLNEIIKGIDNGTITKIEINEGKLKKLNNEIKEKLKGLLDKLISNTQILKLIKGMYIKKIKNSADIKGIDNIDKYIELVNRVKGSEKINESNKTDLKKIKEIIVGKIKFLETEIEGTKKKNKRIYQNKGY